ncbi:MAG: hypothetical protein UT22_C0024G0002 [Parcubacteria group bacterium GW2011_GWC2_39_11]|nr:MAG: hypothetical protein UT22_C0024G0002 [Parcubacteria group bacterium GW2011_GWC2_39_11]
MKFSKEIFDMLGWSEKSEDFVIGKNNFSDLQINSTPAIEQFYYFFNQKGRNLIKQFILNEGKQVDYICRVTLIKKNDKFTPRLSFSVRDKIKKITEESEIKPTNIKANVSLDGCYDNFWKLISFLQSIREIEIPQDSFSLISQGEVEIVTALRGRDTSSIVNIIKQLSNTEGVKLSQEDVNQLLKRREKLEKFKTGLDNKISDESKWQSFFEKNKWIFGYGLDYHILRQEQAQPHYGGDRVDGQGGQRGDYLTSTMGDLSFTVLVEIKTPVAPLLQGTKEIRNGAWSLSKELTDAVSQIEANIAIWEKDGSRQDDNKDRFESENIFTVKPKGIIVIGSLSQLDTRSKRETFQRFRKSIHGIDIITFDELFQRAKFIVGKD